MSDIEPSGPLPPDPPAPRVTPWAGIPWIWAIPVIALLIVAWLAIQTLADRGATITISFANGEGIEPGRTTIRYKNVDLGRVLRMALSPDRSQVVVTAEMRRDAVPLLRAKTEFWVVRPRLGFSGISGLSTIVSGSYIGMLPGDGQPGVRAFKGIENPPPQQGLLKGQEYLLLTERLPPISDDAPVYFHGVKVGEVTGHELSDRDGKVSIRIFVYDPHHALVHPQTAFWVRAGVTASFGSRGLEVRTESLQTVLSGGIVFDTPSAALAGAASPPDARFVLYAGPKEAEEAADPLRVSYRVVFPGSLQGLVVGTPVALRGIPIGQVSALRIEYDPASDRLVVPATIEIAPRRIVIPGEPPLAAEDETTAAAATGRLFERLVARGLRARLVPDNVLLGSREVDLDFVANAAPARLLPGEPYPELPAVESAGLNEMARSAAVFLDKLSALPLADLVGELRGMVRDGDRLVSSPALKRSLQALDRTLANTEQLTHEARQQVGPLLVKLNAAAVQLNATLALLGNDPRARTDLAHTLSEFKDAARSIRVLADYLERHPESLLRGKPQEATR